jgi:hypothetical protein
MSSSHHRVLVSSRGDGNWPTTGGSQNRIGADGSIYFPFGDAAGTVPTSAQDFTNDIDFSGWGTKSNWIVQANLASGTSCTIAVFAMRPTGIEELVVAAVTLDSTATPPVNSFTYGGIAAERIAGPVSHFRFLMASASGAPRVDCYVTAWNEGDIVT